MCGNDQGLCRVGRSIVPQGSGALVCFGKSWLQIPTYPLRWGSALTPALLLEVLRFGAVTNTLNAACSPGFTSRIYNRLCLSKHWSSLTLTPACYNSRLAPLCLQSCHLQCKINHRHLLPLTYKCPQHVTHDTRLHEEHLNMSLFAFVFVTQSPSVYTNNRERTLQYTLNRWGWRL